MNLEEGSTLRGGKYRIEKELGNGTFGITYLATVKVEVQGSLGKMEVPANVAIKEFFISKRNSRGSDCHTVIGTDGKDWEMYRIRFRKEAENLTKLDHPNIVKVLDVFDENCTTYFVMQYVDGENLNDYLKRNHPLEDSEAVEIVRTVGGALQYMHDRRILHLDLKPGNIMRSKEGKIYLIDFGLSKQFTDEGNQATSYEFGKGTKGYAPIEQDAEGLREGEFAPTLDVYALGAVLFKLLTANTPPLALSVLSNGLPTESLKKYNRSQHLIDVIIKAMAPLKKERCQSILEFLNILNNHPYQEESTELTVVSIEESRDYDYKKKYEILLDEQLTKVRKIEDDWNREKYAYNISRFKQVVNELDEINYDVKKLHSKAVLDIGTEIEKPKLIDLIESITSGIYDDFSELILGEDLFNTDPFKAFELYKKWAEKGYAEANYKLALMYAEGRGVERSYINADNLVKKAAEQGHPEAQFRWGMMLPTIKMNHTGTGFERSDMQSDNWIKQSAEQGYAEAQYALGAKYHFREQNFKEASIWYRKAAEQGHTLAQWRLGLMGLDEEKASIINSDSTESINWLKKAAKEDGYDSFTLGLLYETGGLLKNGSDVINLKIEKNYFEALKWYNNAINKGVNYAKFHLAIAYFHGRLGLDRDVNKTFSMIRDLYLITNEEKYEKRTKWSTKWANAYALNYAYMLYRGVGTTRERNLAKRIYKKLIKALGSDCFFNIKDYMRFFYNPFFQSDALKSWNKSFEDYDAWLSKMIDLANPGIAYI